MQHSSNTSEPKGAPVLAQSRGRNRQPVAARQSHDDAIADALAPLVRLLAREAARETVSGRGGSSNLDEPAVDLEAAVDV